MWLMADVPGESRADNLMDGRCPGRNQSKQLVRADNIGNSGVGTCGMGKGNGMQESATCGKETEQ